MEVVNPQEHRSCFYYGCKEKPIIEVRELEEGKRGKFLPSKNKILFVLEGEGLFVYKDYPVKKVSKGGFFFIPSGGEFSYRATREAQVLVIRLLREAVICEGCSMEELYREKMTTDDFPEEASDSTPNINLLEVNAPLWSFLNGLRECLLAGFHCQYYCEIKIKELQILLRACYSKSELRKFYSLVLSPDTRFSEYIRENHHKYKSVSELAASIHMTPKNFARKFAQVFGEAPLRWMFKEKARKIYRELRTGDKSIAQIADEYGFSSQPHFNKFCKQELGQTPGEIYTGKK